MKIRLYDVPDQNTGELTNPREVDLRDVFPDDDESYRDAAEELQKNGRVWIGGGAAGLFYASKI